MKKKLMSVLVILMVSVLFAGCGSTQQTATPDATNPAAGGNTVEAKTLTITHELGQTVIDQNPQKVIVFDYGMLETLDYLGINVIGLPKSNLPAALEKFNGDQYANVGTLQEPDFEKIFELEPDVILISGRQMTHYEELSKIAPTIYFNTTTGNYLENLNKHMTILGELFMKEEQIQSELDNIAAAVEALNKQVHESGANALIVLTNDGNMSAFGAGSRFGVIHDSFGFVPVDDSIQVSTHGQSVTYEYILKQNPDYIFVIDRAVVTGGEGSAFAHQMFDNAIIKQTKAYQNDKIVYLDAHLWYVASGGLTGTKSMIEDVKGSL